MSRPSPRTERLGLLGGTFDPPHIGHVAAARKCLETLSLDRLLFVVANEPWQKSPLRRITPAEDRLAMAKAAAGEVPRAEVSRIELDRGGPSYTIETVEKLREEAELLGSLPPDVFLIVGADVVAWLPTWHRVDELRGLVTLVVVARPNMPPSSLVSEWRSVGIEGLDADVSSSQVRDLLEQGASADDLVPESVRHCILLRGLYAVRR